MLHGHECSSHTCWLFYIMLPLNDVDDTLKVRCTRRFAQRTAGGPPATLAHKEEWIGLTDVVDVPIL